jgi:hypothetical protein
MRPVKPSHVNTYASTVGVAVDSHITGLYTNNFLHFVRFTETPDASFFTARVSAEMRRAVIYKVDVKMDINGVIEVADCECSAGTDPDSSCKHTLLVLYALTQQKKGLKTRETCTQQLQQFHKVQPHKGSPVKVQNLNLTDKQLANLKTYNPLPSDAMSTPRYEEHFRNVWANSRQDVVIKQLLVPANIHAVCHDHDYEAKTPEDKLLAQLGVTELDGLRRREVEFVTRGQAASERWKQERKLRMHASKFGRMCCQKEGKDNLVRSLINPRSFSSAPTDHGRKYESVALDKYEQEQDAQLNRDCGIHVHQDVPYLACSPDAIDERSQILIEVKCPYKARNEKISSANIEYLLTAEDGVSMSLVKKHDYYYQVQGSMMCTGLTMCHFVVFTLKDFVVIPIARDDEFIATMSTTLHNFFNSHFRPALLNKMLYKRYHNFDFD